MQLSYSTKGVEKEIIFTLLANNDRTELRQLLSVGGVIMQHSDPNYATNSGGEKRPKGQSGSRPLQSFSVGGKGPSGGGTPEDGSA